MSEKYIDLAPLIASMHDQPLGTMRVALGLLDEFASEHPDQVPGRTITESEVDLAAAEVFGSDWRAEGPCKVLLNRLGLLVAPDPEPTNAEKLVEDLKAYAGLDSKTAQAVAEDMTREGWTKAPGGDDDH